VLDSHLLPMDSALEELTRIEVTADEVKTLRHGHFPARQMPDQEDLKAYQIETGEFIGVVSIRGGEIRTKRLVVTENFI
jgi:tRNA U55 pseudouridine synthase TruB